MAASSSSSSPRWSYDVFLSFRGEDTRKTITNHLYEALRRQGIVVFRDDDELERGKAIADVLIKAIEESRSTIVILSQRYADSKWCLRELAKIVHCKNTLGQTVLVVFHKINSFDVISPTGIYENFFIDHESNIKENFEEVQSWRYAMREVGGLFGWHVNDETETEKVQEIVKHVFNHLRPDLLSNDENLVGMNLRLSRINILLGMGLDDVRFIGIWGMGGIGKTTIARALYKIVAREFHGSCILRNVRQALKNVGGLVSLQEKLLSMTLLKGKVRIKDGDGAAMIKENLQNRKVFVVLDDVDRVSQVKELIGGEECLGFGSRVIITTRDEGLLVSLGVDRRYNVESFNDEESLQLFCHEAFGVKSFKKGYLDLCMQFIKHAEGLPSEIKVLGSSLHGRLVPSWEDAVKNLNVSLNREIYENLKISYDALEIQERRMFLDIACFLTGRSKDQVIDTFKSFGIDAADGLKILQEKSLVTVHGNKVQVHNLLKKLGQEIFLEESSGKCCRLWRRKDVNHALRHNQGVEDIESIVLDLDEHGESHLNAKFFSTMTGLKVLLVHNVFLSGDLEYLSDKLRLLSWHGYPLRHLPSRFQPSELLELSLPNSCLENLWKGAKRLDKLKIINLSNSEFLIKTPNLSMVPNLERLVLNGCIRLQELHQSVGALKHLILLDLKDCKSLKRIPFNICFESLKILVLSGCSRLENFPEIVENMKLMTELHLDGTAIRELHQSIGKLTSLELLDLRHCKNLLTLPDSIGCMTSLKHLALGGCSKLDQIPDSLGNISCLKKLDVSGTSISHVPLSLRLLANLEVFNCEGLSRKFCYSFFPFWDTPRNYNSHSFGLKLMTCLSNFHSVKVLIFSDCKLVDGDLPNNLSCLSSLQFLDLSRNFFANLPNSLCQLINLRCLVLDNCSRLQSLPKLPLGLRYVLARNCVSLKEHYNQEDHRPISETEVMILSYPTSAEHQNSKMANLMQSKIYTAWENGHPCFFLSFLELIRAFFQRHMALPNPLAFLFIFLHIAAFSAESSLLYNGFSQGKRLVRDGAAVVMPSGALRLTNTSQNVIGRAFYPDAIHLINNTSLSSFSTTFVFAIKPSSPGHGGHVFAFTLAPSTKFEGAESGHFLGLFNRSNDGSVSNHIFAVEFDTVKGHDELKNSRGNDVGININGVVSVSSQHASYSYLNDTILDLILIDSGDPIAVWIEYDGSRKSASVYIGLLTDQKPEKPLLSCPIDLTPVLKEKMYVGFAASTGIETSSHYILGWSFAVNAPARPLRYSLLPIEPERQSHPRASNPQFMVIVLVSSILVIVGIVVLAFLFRKMRKAESLEDWEKDCPHRFSYKDLYTATNGFKDSQQIGIGGFGSVYKGSLRSTGAEIAVKRVKRNSSQGLKEFAAEIESLGRLRHKNLVNLQGWCKKNNDLLIVYDYISNGSLHSLLYHPIQNFVLNWEQRLNILKGIAAGLLYLHEDWEQVVIHRDVKPSNVLIDDDMNARLSDFGLSRQYDHDQVSHTTKVVGTIGYIPPELFRTGKASKSADVYAYGVVVLEVACGRKPLGSGQFVLVDWVMKLYETGNVVHVADPKLGSDYKVEEMEMVLKLGLLCTQWNPEARPCIRQVTRFLNGEDPLPALEPWAGYQALFESSSRSMAKEVSTMWNSPSSMSVGPISSASINIGR
ncbi:TMV resistance protein N-like [Cucurbita pepo subsp. pepo]|uniref:TMV resistance protein N-like n=1 Tax=Cucurbita pepo subsp. pepo TaxID=3664 RepID=UPI000C9D6D2B|nr:TMV resistance protein N-like [Cucurbita pepo subsp. pepo]